MILSQIVNRDQKILLWALEDNSMLNKYFRNGQKNAIMQVFAVTLTATLLSMPAHTETIDFEIQGEALETVLDDGVMIDGVYVANVLTTAEDILTIPYYFEGIPETTNISISFNDEELEVLSGLPLIPDLVEFLVIDSSSITSQSGELKIILSSTSTETAELILLDDIEPIVSFACNVINDPNSSTRRWGINQYNLRNLADAVALPVYSMSKNRKIQSVACDPSGGNILFSMKDSLGGDFEIYELDVITSNITQLTDNDTDDVDVTRSQDRQTIAWQMRLADNRQAIALRRMDEATGQYTVKTMASASPFVQPSLSPNGQWLTFVQLRDNFFTVMRYDIANNKYKEVKSIARRKKLYHPSISDDGNKVGWSERLSQIRYRVKNLTENTTVDAVTNVNGVEHAVLSGDGKSVFYSVNSNDSAETYLTTLDTQDTVAIGEALTSPARYLSSSWVGGLE